MSKRFRLAHFASALGLPRNSPHEEYNQDRKQLLLFLPSLKINYTESSGFLLTGPNISFLQTPSFLLPSQTSSTFNPVSRFLSLSVSLSQPPVFAGPTESPFRFAPAPVLAFFPSSPNSRSERKRVPARGDHPKTFNQRSRCRIPRPSPSFPRHRSRRTRLTQQKTRRSTALGGTIPSRSCLTTSRRRIGLFINSRSMRAARHGSPCAARGPVMPFPRRRQHPQ